MKYERRFFDSTAIDYWVKCRDLFGSYLYPFSISVILASLNQLVGTSAFLYYGPEIIELAHSDISSDAEPSLSADVLDNFIIGGFVVGNLISAFLIINVGRRKVVLTGLPVAFVTALILSFTMHECNYGDEDESDESVK